MEHVVDNKIEKENYQILKEKNIILSKEERERKILSKFRESMSKSLENLNIKNLIDIKDKDDNISVLDEDNISITSSKYFAVTNKQKNSTVKLPFIIGTIDYFKNEYLGLSNNAMISNTISNNSYAKSLSNYSIQENRFTNNNFQKNLMENFNNEDKTNNLNMNMDLIEQIYEKRNSEIDKKMDHDSQLNELLFKGKQESDINFKNIQNMNKIHEEKFVDFSKENDKNQLSNVVENTIDPIYERFKEKDYYRNRYNSLFDNKTNNNFLGDNMGLFNENINSKFDEIKENKDLNDKMNNPSLLDDIKSKRRVTLDNFVKRSNLFDNIYDENEEDDDNMGLFNLNKLNKENNLNLLQKKNNIFDKMDNELEKEENEHKKGKIDNLLNIIDENEEKDCKEELENEKEKDEDDSIKKNIIEKKYEKNDELNKKVRNSMGNLLLSNTFNKNVIGEKDEIYEKDSEIPIKISKRNINEKNKKNNSNNIPAEKRGSLLSNIT